jgi:hypothetical protein
VRRTSPLVHLKESKVILSFPPALIDLSICGCTLAGEEDIKKMSSIENVQEQSVALGKKAIGLAASGAISLLNTIEQVSPSFTQLTF